MLQKAGQLMAQARESRFADPDGAMRQLEEAASICRQGLSATLAAMGQIDRDAGRVEQALARYAQAAAAIRGADRGRYAHHIRHIADIHLDANRPDLARPRFEEALAIYRAEPGTSPLDLANAIRGYAILTAAAGETEASRALWTEAKALYESAGVTAGSEECERRLAALPASAP